MASAVLARDRKATAEFVRLYTDPVHKFVWRRLVPKVDLVEDLVQDVMLAAWAGLKSYSGEAPLRVWILGIARHKVDDHYRSRLRLAVSLDQDDGVEEPQDLSEPVELALDRMRASERASQILAEMREEYALLLRWRYWDGRMSKAIAEGTGRTEKSIERMLARARAEFRSRWETTERSGREQ